MRIVIRILLLTTLVLCFSCEKQGIFVKCSECTENEPVKTYLEIKLDINYSGTATVINVYEGNLEDNILYKTIETSNSEQSISVTLNKKYTVTASYYIANSYYIAVDSATPRVGYSKEQCDKPCYFTYDKVVDLRIKYTK